MHLAHTSYSEPTPPSSHVLSWVHWQVLSHVTPKGTSGRGDGGGGGDTFTLQPALGPQSWQSVHAEQSPYSEPRPPSSQSSSLWYGQLSKHVRSLMKCVEGGSGGLARTSNIVCHLIRFVWDGDPSCLRQDDADARSRFLRLLDRGASKPRKGRWLVYGGRVEIRLPIMVRIDPSTEIYTLHDPCLFPIEHRTALRCSQTSLV